MALTLYWYPNCGTCKEAKKWLDDNNIDYTSIHIVEHPPSEQTILDMMDKSGLPAKKFFNTSGKSYREKHIKDKIADASNAEMAKILASDGMLIKRPLITDGETVTVGFNFSRKKYPSSSV